MAASRRSDPRGHGTCRHRARLRQARPVEHMGWGAGGPVPVEAVPKDQVAWRTMLQQRGKQCVMPAVLPGAALLRATRKASGTVIVDVALTGGKRQGGATRLVGS
jgi:hypothetical protein